MANFSVMWQFPGMKAERASYEMPDLQTLLRVLQKAEDVSISTTEKLFVHYHATNGDIMEVVSHEKEKGFSVVNHQLGKPVERQPSNVVSIKKAKKDKPHIRLAIPADETPFVVAGNGLYKAYRA